MELDDQDSCRICRSGSEIGAPLYHPCKCAGSIRYCHQECLLEWLQHSRKKYCELCNHPFIFHKRYSKSLPSHGRLPAYLYFRRLLLLSAKLARTAARFILVAFTWLAVLPYANINMWRFLFLAADVASWVALPELSPNQNHLYNSTNGAPAAGALSPPPTPPRPSHPIHTERRNPFHYWFDAFMSNPAPSHALQEASSSVCSSRPFRRSNGQVDPVSAFSRSMDLYDDVFKSVVTQRSDSAQQYFSPAHALFSYFSNVLSPRAMLKAIAHDVFQGQMLTCVLVVLFVGIFLLREWILQHVPQPIEQQDPLLQPHQELDEVAARQEFRGHHLDEARDEMADHLAEQVQPLHRPVHPAALVAREHAAAHMEAQVRAAQAALELAQAREQLPSTEPRHSWNDALAPYASSETADSLRANHGSSDHDPYVDALAALDSSSESLSRDEKVRLFIRHIEAAESGAGLSHTDHGYGQETRHVARFTAQDSTSDSSPQSTSLHRMEMADGNVGSRLVPSWQEGSMSANVEPTWPSPHIPDSPTLPTDAAAENADEEDQKVGESDPPPPLNDTVGHTVDNHVERRAPFGSESQAAAPTTAEPRQRLLNFDDDASDSTSDDMNVHYERPAARDRQAGAVGQAEPVEPGAADVHGARAAPAAAGIDLDDIDLQVVDDAEADMGFAEEMDGMLEAVGLRGPLQNILQNLLLMIMLCSFVMLVFICIPYLVGKVLGPGLRLLQLVSLPIRLLLYVTDPLFDGLIRLGARIVMPLIHFVSSMGSSAPSVAQESLSPQSPTRASIGMASQLISKLTGSFPGLSSNKAAHLTLTSNIGLGVPLWLIKLVPPLQQLNDGAVFERIQDDLSVAATTGFQTCWNSISSLVQDMFQRLNAHSLGKSNVDRAFCIGLGHLYWIMALGVQRRLAADQKPKRSYEESTFSAVMEQHALILKVVFFIFIELVVFPLGCGLLLDLCLMPMFKDPNLFAWVERGLETPLTFGFTRWMGGTIYMFIFAQYVHTTRGILRPGVLCWIRDPNDPGFHPIRDILEKRSLVQLRKIGASAAMYAGILVGAVGIEVYLLRYAFKATGVLPLRWKPMDPATEVPLDLLAVHLALPFLVDWMDPDTVFANQLEAWWKWSSRLLRLSTYMIGGEFPEEERSGRSIISRGLGWFSSGDDAGMGQPTVEQKGDDDIATSRVVDGGYCRVPADDRAVTTAPLIIPVNADGTACDERGAEAIHDQEEAMAKMTLKPEYKTIFMPPRYRLRIGVLLSMLWLSHCAVTMLGLAVPLLVGRRGYALLADLMGDTARREPHDFYPLVLGYGMLAFSVWITKATLRLFRRAQVRALRVGANKAVAPLMFVLVSLLRRGVRLLRLGVLGVGIGLIVPALVGLTINQCE